MFDVTVALVVWGCVFYMLWTLVADGLIGRVAPKYAARRRVKQNTRYERRMERFQARSARRADRVLEWARSNPEDPVAQALLSRQFDDSPEGRLRMRQKIDEEYERNRETREAEFEARQKEELEWALANPESPVAKRHLSKSLDDARRQHEHVSGVVDHCQRMLDFDHLEQHERDDYQIRLGRARLELEAAQQAVIEIELALGVDALSEQQ